MENIKKNALPLKTIDDALKIRNHLLQNLEKASQSESKEEIEKYKTIVIAGGGPTGVEVAGMLAELGKIVITNEYPELQSYKGALHLVSATNSLLTPMSEQAQKEAFSQLHFISKRLA
jgi:NADH dehydrogenase